MISIRTRLTDGFLRGFDVVVSSVLIVTIIFPITVMLWPLFSFHGGSMIFKSQRIGKDGETFVLYKFRTMVLDAPVVSTDNLVDPARFLLPFGSLLRRYSVDELPQFWNVLKGDLGIVGPRPSLPTEHGLISARRKYGVDRLTPGITGYAQVNGRDAISMDQKVAFDLFFLNNRSIFLYLTILAKTLVVVLSAKNVVH